MTQRLKDAFKKGVNRFPGTIAMPRTSNIFHKLVTGEDSTTELLCNLMRFGAFRRPLLARFLSDVCANEIAFDDIDTQIHLGDYGRPDIFISNDKVCALVEVKVRPDQGLTGNQPEGYFSFLSNDETPERWLVFLVPKDWEHLQCVKKSLDAHRDDNIRTSIVHWDDVLTVIEENDLQDLNPFLGEFHQLLAGRFRPMSIVFSPMEVDIVFSREIPATLSKLDQLMHQIEEKSSAYKPSPLGRPKSLCPEEYGLYFTNARDEYVLWFGVWTDFWKQEGIPLCFGVWDKWPVAVKKAFRASYKGSTKRFQDWTLGWISQDSLSGDNVVEQVWAQLAPVLEALVGAGA